MTRDHEECEGALTHSPLPLWTERHHIFPMYLCRAAGLLERPEVVPLCGTEHENVHHAIHHLLADGTQGGHRFAVRTQSYVDQFWAWWQEALSGQG